jgi:hypothetical protein
MVFGSFDCDRTLTYIYNNKRLDEIFEKDINRNGLMVEFVWQKL